MNPTLQLRRLPNRRFPFAAAALACALLALPVQAQKINDTPASTTPADETIRLQTFSVTGSNIKRLDIETALPVTVLGRDTMETRGASEAAELLTALPEITGLPGNETAFAGATARGDNATVSMRGLPSANTLILLDGRRLVPHPISQAEAGVPTLSVNVNQLPNEGIDHIDVLRDGASSIYGTDAVAGVINYQMKKNFRGTEILTHYGETEYHDGIEYRATVTHGQDFAQGKGRVLVVADYYDRGAIFSANRSFSANPDNSYRAPAPWNTPTNTTFNLLSSSSAYGSYILGTPTATDQYGTVTTFVGARPTGVPASYAATTGLFVLTPLVGGGVGFASATPTRTATGPGHDYYWNNSAYRVIQPESKRINLFTSGEYDLTSRITTFTELSMYQANSTTYREPDAYSQSTDGYLIVPASNPYNPFGTRYWSTTGAPNADGTPRLTGTPTAVSITNKRFTDFATRTDTVTDSVYRGVWGLRGKLFESWTWEGALLYSTARGIEYEAGATRRSLLAAAINQTDPTKAFNPFGQSFAVQNGALVSTGAYQNPQSVISTFQAPYIRNGITKLGSTDFHAGGDVLPIWAETRSARPSAGNSATRPMTTIGRRTPDSIRRAPGLIPPMTTSSASRPTPTPTATGMSERSTLKPSSRSRATSSNFPGCSRSRSPPPGASSTTATSAPRPSQRSGGLAAALMGAGARLLQPGLSRTQSRRTVHRHAHPHRHEQHRHLPEHRDQSGDRRPLEPAQHLGGESQPET